MVSNLLLADLPPQTSLKMGSTGKNHIFSEHGHVAYQIKWNLKMQLHSSKYFAHRSPMPLSIGKKSTISEHGHVAYQIKRNHEMQQHSRKYFAHRPPLPLTKVNFFRTWLCYISS